MSVSLAEALRILASSENVTELDLSYDGIADEGAKALAAALERNSTVKSLDLTCNGIGAEGAEALAAALERNSTVESLDLYYNGIGDEGAEALAAALERNSTVKSLDLWGNGIGAGGAKALAAALERNSTVKSLNLRYNSIGSEGGKALAESLQVQGVAFWLASEKQVLAFAQVKEALDLRGNYLKTLPAKVLQLLHLETLDVSNNHLRTLPCEVGQLTCLCKLMLSNNRLEALPVELLSICGLEMQVDTTAVQLLAEVLKSNIAIAAFDLTLKGPQGAFGADVDKALATALQVTGHGFWFKQQQRVLAFAQCDKIKDLDLRHNFLETLPSKVLQLLHLETLVVSNNHLRTLPCEVGQLTWLRTLKVDSNVLEKLPMHELLSLPRLKSLACKGNRKLCWPPQEIVRRGGRDVVKYLRLDTSRSVAFCMLTHHRLGQGQLVSRDAGAVLTPAHRHSLCLPTEILRMVLHSANDVAFLEVLLEKVEESDGASESDQEEEEEEESD